MTKTKSKLVKVDCYKCSGRGHIEAYSGIANGVCFACKGSGFFMVNEKKAAARKPALSPYMAKQIETIQTGDLASMSYTQLADLRNTAYWRTPHCPNLLQIWRERGGEAAFMEKKDENRRAIRGCW